MHHSLLGERYVVVEGPSLAWRLYLLLHTCAKPSLRLTRRICVGLLPRVRMRRRNACVYVGRHYANARGVDDDIVRELTEVGC